MGYFKNRINAFGYAFSGIYQAFRQETHLKIHAVIALLVIGLAAFFEVCNEHWILLLLAITLVIALEMLNSAVEKLCNIIKPELDPRIKYIKDVSAGAVLIVCLFAVAAGIIVFSHYF
ncbi:diacylglycerol kinase [Sphingobacteriaceae bacterium]|nr:diacylglycerol kinase [Sphingobacteriaceae bacterium]